MADASVTVGLGADAGEFSSAMDTAALSYKEFEAVLKAGKATFDATRTSVEKYEAELSQLQHQLDSGAISQDTYNRAAAKVGKAYAGSPFKTANGDVRGLTDSLSASIPTVGKFTSALASAGPVGLAIAATLGVVIAEVAAIQKILGTAASEIGEAIGRIDDLADAAAGIGVSTKALSELQYAAGFANVSTEDLSTSLGKMLKVVGEAAIEGGEAEEAFQRIGLSGKLIAKLPVEEQFKAIAEALKGVDNPSQRAAVAAEIFGKSWQKLGSLIDQGAAGIQNAQNEARLFGQSIDDVDASAIAAANDEMQKITLAFKGAANVAAGELAPAITALTSQITDFIKASGGVEPMVLDYFAGLRAEIDLVTKSLQLAAPWWSAMAKATGLGKEFEEARKAAELGAQLDAKRLEMQRQRNALLPEEAEETKEVASAVDKVAAAMAKLRFEGDTAGLSDAEKKLVELSGMGADADQLIEANAALAQAQQAKDAQKAASDAARTLASERKRLDDMLNHALKEGATAGMSETQKKLFELQQAGATDAELEQAKAALEHADAVKKAQQATKKLGDERKQAAKEAENLFGPIEALEKGTAAAFSAILRSRQSAAAARTKQAAPSMSGGVGSPIVPPMPPVPPVIRPAGAGMPNMFAPDSPFFGGEEHTPEQKKNLEWFDAQLPPLPEPSNPPALAAAEQAAKRSTKEDDNWKKIEEYSKRTATASEVNSGYLRDIAKRPAVVLEPAGLGG